MLVLKCQKVLLNSLLCSLLVWFVIVIGMTLSLLAIVLLGGLLSGVSALIMLVSILANGPN